VPVVLCTAFEEQARRTGTIGLMATFPSFGGVFSLAILLIGELDPKRPELARSAAVVRPAAR
jgi:hypothetical protein